jgi:hypothetical protein
MYLQAGSRQVKKRPQNSQQTGGQSPISLVVTQQQANPIDTAASQVSAAGSGPAGGNQVGEQAWKQEAAAGARFGGVGG